MTEIEIIRYVYINLGKMMNFDLKYTFGNTKEKKKIATSTLSNEKINEDFKKRSVVCRSLTLIFKRILAEFDIQVDIQEDDSYQRFKHVYNVIKLKDGRKAKFDLEEDLEFIQTESKTRHFGIIEDKNSSNSQQMLISDKELKRIDMTIAEYIPWGFYFDDMIPLLKFGTKSMPIEEKLRSVLDNLDVYVRDSNIGYRERIYYHNRILHEIFSPKELNRIQQIDCYRLVNGEKKFVSCVVLNRNKKDNMIFLYSDKTGRYEEIGIQELAEMVKNGLILLSGIQGLRKYVKSDTKTSEREKKAEATFSILSLVQNGPDEDQK